MAQVLIWSLADCHLAAIVLVDLPGVALLRRGKFLIGLFALYLAHIGAALVVLVPLVDAVD